MLEFVIFTLYKSFSINVTSFNLSVTKVTFSNVVSALVVKVKGLKEVELMLRLYGVSFTAKNPVPEVLVQVTYLVVLPYTIVNTSVPQLETATFTTP